MLKKAYVLWLFGLALLSPLAQAQTVQFESATYEVNEGDGTVTIAVTISQLSLGKVTVDYSASGGDATEGADYTVEGEGTLTWELPDDTSKPITVTINDDADLEGDETFNLTLSNPDGATIGSPDTAEVTITDNDSSSEPGTLQFSEAKYKVGEGDGTVDVIVTRVDGTDGEVTLKYKALGDVTEDDYTTTPNKLKWEDGEGGNKIITVTIEDDDVEEGKETLKLKLKKVVIGDAEIGEQNTTKVIITDNDPSVEPGTLQFSEATYEVGEGDKIVEITVTRVDGSDGVASVEYTTKDISAEAGPDYTETSDTLSWNDGDTEAKTFTVVINDDTDVEDNETFKLKLKKAEGATIGSPDTTEVTITDNDSPSGPVLQFSEPTYEVDEGNGTVTITVSISEAPDETVMVDYNTSDGSATEPDDYSSNSGTLQWELLDGEDKTITVQINDDTETENNETFNLTLENPVGAQLGDQSTAVVTITDNDSPSGPVLQFSEPTYEVDEGNGTVTITVSISEAPDETVMVDYNTSDGSATEPDDYSSNSGTLQWELLDGEDKTITVQINDDTETENNETFNLTLENPVGAQLGDQSTAVVTITDNDSSSGPTLQFSEPMYEVNEGDETVTITVTISEAPGDTVTVDYSASGGDATEGDDYSDGSGTLTWELFDDTPKTFTVAINDDADPEGDETFNLTLANPTDATIGSPGTAEVTIIDNDDESDICDNVTQIPTEECQALIVLYESTDGANWTDNSGWNMTNTPCDNWEGVTCENGHVSRLYLYSNNLNGEMPPELGDLSGLKRLLLFENALSGVIPPELGDLNQLEYLWLQNSGLCGDIPETLMDTVIPSDIGYLKLDNNHLITDVSDELEDWLNDRNPGWEDSQTECLAEPNTVQFVQGSYEINETDGTVTLMVSRTEGDGAISVDYATVGGSATEDEDYNGQTDTLSWAENDFDDKEIQITINDDDEPEGAETFNVELDNATGGATLGALETAEVTIIDDDDESDICDNVTQIPTEECQALIALYESTDGANWDNNDGWNDTSTPCNDDDDGGWYGVTCVSEQVTRLYLYSNELNGEIPPELGDLSGLERLLLFDNALSGVIPPELGDLSQLEYLWLQNSGLCGDIPETLMETAIPSDIGYLKLDSNHLETDVSDEMEAWLEARNPTWDDDQTACPAPSVLQFSKSTYSVNENKGSVFITVTRTGSSEGEVSVVCATSSDSATAGDDYNESFEVLNWADGDSEDKVCQIDILDDSDSKANGSFIVSLGYPYGAELGALNTVVVIFIDNE
jgi:hypothetical protein